MSSITDFATSLPARVWNAAAESFGETIQSIVDQDARETPVVANGRYENVIYLNENGGPSSAKTAGFGLPTLVPQGFDDGSGSVNFGFEHSDSGSSVGWTLFALGTGDWILPDGRNLGLAQDALTVSSISLSLQGLTAAPLVAGAGFSPQLPIGIPPGLEFFAVGIGVDLGQGLVASITDVVPIDT